MPAQGHAAYTLVAIAVFAVTLAPLGLLWCSSRIRPDPIVIPNKTLPRRYGRFTRLPLRPTDPQRREEKALSHE